MSGPRSLTLAFGLLLCVLLYLSSQETFDSSCACKHLDILLNDKTFDFLQPIQYLSKKEVDAGYQELITFWRVMELGI